MDFRGSRCLPQLISGGLGQAAAAVPPKTPKSYGDLLAGCLPRLMQISVTACRLAVSKPSNFAYRELAVSKSVKLCLPLAARGNYKEFCPVGCSSTCRMLVYLSDACLPVGCKYGMNAGPGPVLGPGPGPGPRPSFRLTFLLDEAFVPPSTFLMLVFLSDARLPVRCLFACRLLVYLLDACLLVRCLSSCWVLVYLLGVSMA